MGEGEEESNRSKRIRQSGELFNPGGRVRRRGCQRRLSASAHERPDREHCETIAAQALNGVADTASDETTNHSPKTRGRGDKIGQRDKMNEPRQS